MNIDVNTYNRENIQFYEKAKEIFSFLITDYYFTVSKYNPYEIIFSKNNCSLTIYHERISYELYAIIRVKDFDFDFRIPLEEIIFSFNANINCCFQTSSAIILYDSLKQIKDAVCQYGIDILLGKKDEISRIFDFHMRYIENQSIRTKLYEMEVRASLAWKEKDYSTVIKQYEPNIAYLDKLQIWKLNYAKQKYFTERKS